MMAVSPACCSQAVLAVQVVQAIGAAEAELLNWGLPKRIDGDGAINLIRAAETCGVTQYVQVSSLGAGKAGWPSGEILAI